MQLFFWTKWLEIKVASIVRYGDLMPMRKLMMVYVFLLLIIGLVTGQSPSTKRDQSFQALYRNGLEAEGSEAIIAIIKEIENLPEKNRSEIASYQYNLAQLYFRAKNPEKAIDILKSWKSPYAAFYLGTLLLRLERREEAISCFSGLAASEQSYIDARCDAIASSILDTYVLVCFFAGIDTTQQIGRWLAANRISKTELDESRGRANIDIELLLRSMWPN